MTNYGYTISNNFVSDGKAVIQINENNFARAGIKFYQKTGYLYLQN